MNVQGCGQQFKISESKLEVYTNTTDTSTPDNTVIPTPIRENSYAPTGNYISRADCKKWGWKGVCARKSWHGDFGFDYDEGCANAGSEPCMYEPFKSVPYAKRYLSRTASGNFYAWFGWNTDGSPDELTVTHDREWQIGAHTGIITGGGGSTFTAMTPDGMGGSVNGGFDACGSASVTLSLTMGFGGGACPTWPAYVSEVLAGMSDDPPPDWVVTNNLTATGWNFEVQKYAQVIPFGGGTAVRKLVESMEVSVSLGGLYDSAAVNADCDYLLSQWPIDDDVISTWQQNAACNVIPLITFVEVPGSVGLPGLPAVNLPAGSTAATYTEVYVDANAAVFANQGRTPGDVLGRPTYQVCGLPHDSAPEPFYDFSFKNFGGITTYGAFAPQANWTQWCNKELRDAIELFPGKAAIFFASQNNLDTNCNGIGLFNPSEETDGCLIKIDWRVAPKFETPGVDWAHVTDLGGGNFSSIAVAPRQQYILETFTSNFRAAGETCRLVQMCLSETCSGAEICASYPSDLPIPDQVTLTCATGQGKAGICEPWKVGLPDFPELILDFRYGVVWNAKVVQQMVDPLNPPRDIFGNIMCDVPYFEAVCAPPGGADSHFPSDLKPFAICNLFC